MPVFRIPLEARRHLEQNKELGFMCGDDDGDGDGDGDSQRFAG